MKGPCVSLTMNEPTYLLFDESDVEVCLDTVSDHFVAIYDSKTG
jgi:hypothetical protein